MDDNSLAELRTYLLDLVYALFQDDSIDGIDERLPSPPSMVTGVRLHPHRWDPERIDGADLDGTFSTTAVMSLDLRGGTFESRYDVVTAYVTPNDLPEHLGARLSMQGQPGMTVNELAVRAETLRNPPVSPDAAATVTSPVQAPAPSPRDAEPAVATSRAAAPSGPLIGGVEPVPRFDLSGLLADEDLRRIEVVRAFDDFERASCYRAADPGIITYGLPPDFEPVIKLGTGGMVIGLMIDAPELGFIDSRSCLYEISSQGMTLTDARVNALGVVWRSVTEQRTNAEASGDPDQLDRWRAAAEHLKQQMGWVEFAPSGVRGFAWGDKRRKPERSPKGTKWRTDAGGNGVLALVERWGDEPIRRPRSISAALNRAPELAPAASLHALREALVMANRTNDPEAAAEIYRAMAVPLEQLGRDQAAARSLALGSL